MTASPLQSLIQTLEKWEAIRNDPWTFLPMGRSGSNINFELFQNFQTKTAIHNSYSHALRKATFCPCNDYFIKIIVKQFHMSDCYFVCVIKEGFWSQPMATKNTRMFFLFLWRFGEIFRNISWKLQFPRRRNEGYSLLLDF